MKRFEIERDLLLQTCDTLDRVKGYLTDRLLEMKDKQRSYCIHLSTAEVRSQYHRINYHLHTFLYSRQRVLHQNPSIIVISLLIY